MIAIVDYGAGNIQSVKNALDYLGFKSQITDKAAVIRKSDKIIFPGVGSFGDVMASVDKKNLREVLIEAAAKKPFLGICIGMQVLFEKSEESPGIKGLGIFKGSVKKFRTSLKVPQIGWNDIAIQKESILLKDIPEKSFFYFVHSYHPVPKDKSIILTSTEYEEEFASGVEQGNIAAFQFHPERSGALGLRLLRNFVIS
ncbi:MAG TPA: imidazole glycerol phosphate synthase subunit HisH [Candidatus Nanoarchaeia archaeon]|nr:imidazole glycerol phosphate synthase subunit HisH [Candidatus Nanoarchaeia archaeon]